MRVSSRVGGAIVACSPTALDPSRGRSRRTPGSGARRPRAPFGRAERKPSPPFAGSARRATRQTGAAVLLQTRHVGRGAASGRVVPVRGRAELATAQERWNPDSLYGRARYPRERRALAHVADRRGGALHQESPPPPANSWSAALQELSRAARGAGRAGAAAPVG